MNINDLNEHVLLELFSYLSLIEKVKIEIVCKKWHHLIDLKHSQRSIKLYFNLTPHQKLPKAQLCDNKQHKLDKLNDVLDLEKIKCMDLERIDQIFNKFINLKAIYLCSKDLKSLRRNNVLATLSKHVDRLEHFQIELFEGPFFYRDLQLLYKTWSKNLKCLIIMYELDQGLYLNRKTVMKFLEITPNLQVFYLKSPYLTKQTLDYVPANLNSLHLFDTDLDFKSLSTLTKLNGSIFKQLKLSNITDKHLNEITNDLKCLELLAIDSLQLGNNSCLENIKKLENLKQINFCLDGQQVQNIDKEFISIIKNCCLVRKVNIKNAILTDQSLQLVSIYWKNLFSFKLYSSLSSKSKITDQTLQQFTKLNHLNLLALPNHHLSRHLFEQLIDKPKFECLILREDCLFIDKLFMKILSKTLNSKYHFFKLRIRDDDENTKFFKLNRPLNFLLKYSKCFSFDFFDTLYK